MKKNRIGIICVLMVFLAAGSYWVGGAVKERAYRSDRAEQCKALLSFAIQKAEQEDLSDPAVLSALISNVYAAREYCDDVYLNDRLHDLWNDLIFRADSYVGQEQVLSTQLRELADMMDNPT